MFAERNRAFHARINQLLHDHEAAFHGRFKQAARSDLASRISSALHDAFEMGRRENQPNKVAERIEPQE